MTAARLALPVCPDPLQDAENHVHDPLLRRVVLLQPYRERDSTLGPWQQPDRHWVDLEDCTVLAPLLLPEPEPAGQ